MHVQLNFSVKVFSGLILYLMSYTRRDTTEDRKSDISCHEYFESLVVLIYFMDHNTCVRRYLLIHSLSSLSYDRSKASYKASSPHSAIQSFLFQMRVLTYSKELIYVRVLNKSDRVS
jgi:hypothetical protein